jgi:hypothetical protein
MKLLFFVLLLLWAAFSLVPPIGPAGESGVAMEPASGVAGIKADNAELRFFPSAASPIKGLLLKGRTVVIEGRTPGTDTVDGVTDRWYRITTIEGARGWTFGSSLDITWGGGGDPFSRFAYRIDTTRPRSDINLMKINDLERRQSFEEAELLWGTIPRIGIIEYIRGERRFIRNSNYLWARPSPREIYEGIKTCISLKDDARAFIPPSVVTASLVGEWGKPLSGAQLNDLIMKKTAQGPPVLSDLFLLENGAVFYIESPSGWDKSGSKTWMVCGIYQIKYSVFPEMNGKFELAGMVLSGPDSFKSFGGFDRYFTLNRSLPIPSDKPEVYGIFNIVDKESDY